MLDTITQLLRQWKTRNLFLLVHFKKSLGKGFAQEHYSQSGEDILASRLFPHNHKGTYIDVGSYHPKHYSNTYHFYKRGWSGITIDPNPKSVFLFNHYRPRDTHIQMGISEKKEIRHYHLFNHQSCNTFSDTHKEQMLKKPYIEHIGTTPVPCAPLCDIVQVHMSHGAQLDLLSIDVEGMDDVVLRSHDWDTFRPTVVIVEHEGQTLDVLNSSAVYQFLTEKKYTLCAATDLSFIFKDTQ